MRYAVLILIVVAAIGGCNDNETVRGNKTATINQRIRDTAITMLSDGMVVLRMGLGADSYMLSQMNKRDKRYSHCGIVIREHGYPFIYHCLGGETNPNERMRRDSASRFLSPERNTRIAVVSYAMDSIHAQEVKRIVREYYSRHVLFDMNFDLATDDRIYCSELVYKALCRASGDSTYIPVTTAIGHTYAGIDDLYLNKHVNTFWQAEYK